MPTSTLEDVVRHERVYAILLSIFVVILVLTNIIGVKLFLAFPYSMSTACFGAACTLTSGIITYPITFLITDTVSELYGRKRADFMVFIGFAMSLVMVLLVQAVLALPGSPAWVNKDLGYTDVAGMQTAFESVFTLPGTLVFGSMTAYLCAQLLDNRMFHFWRRKTKGRHLWLRNNASTMVSQAADTVIVNTIFLKFGLGSSTLPKYLFSGLCLVYLFLYRHQPLDKPIHLQNLYVFLHQNQMGKFLLNDEFQIHFLTNQKHNHHLF